MLITPWRERRLSVSPWYAWFLQSHLRTNKRRKDKCQLALSSVIRRCWYYYIASSVSGQYEPNHALWLATREGKMALSCLLWATCCVLQEKFPYYCIAFSLAGWLDVGPRRKGTLLMSGHLDRTSLYISYPVKQVARAGRESHSIAHRLLLYYMREDWWEVKIQYNAYGARQEDGKS